LRDQGQRVDVVLHRRLEHGVDYAVARNARDWPANCAEMIFSR